MTRSATCLTLIFLTVSAAAPNKTFHLDVGGLTQGSFIPAPFTCNGSGGGVSPPLSWSGEPDGTRSFALIVDDPDARDFVHWLLWDIPASVHSLATGAKDAGVPGANDFGDRAYGGPCPPAGSGPHTYVFQVFALDVPSVNLKAGKGKDALEQAMRKHVLAKAELRLLYGAR